jgi:hypothetical protein
MASPVEGGDVSEQGTPPSEDGLVVEVGSEDLEHGLVRVHVAQDGRVRIVKREQAKEQQFEGRTDEAHATRLVEAVEGIRGGTFGQRRGIPDEPRYRVLVVREGKPVLEADVWRSELTEAKELATVIADLSRLVDQSSDGQALL